MFEPIPIEFTGSKLPTTAPCKCIMAGSLDLEELNQLIYQRTLPPGLILVQPRMNTYVIAGDEAVSRKALTYLRNSFSGALWWPMN